MRQIECQDCGAPMWEGRRCPWDLGSGCRARSIDALERPRSRREPRVASESTPKARRPARYRPLDQVSRNRRPDRATCETGRHPRPETGRCLECKRQAVRDHRARKRAA